MKKILIVKANYYYLISNKLAQQSINLLKNKMKISVIEVPGIFEIPITIRKNLNKFDGFIALGCVIKGDTDHYDYICQAVSNGIMNISIKSHIPVLFGVLSSFFTVD